MQAPCALQAAEAPKRLLVLSIATEMVSAPPDPGILQGGQQVSSTILMYTEKRGRGTILVAIESIIRIDPFPRQLSMASEPTENFVCKTSLEKIITT